MALGTQNLVEVYALTPSHKIDESLDSVYSSSELGETFQLYTARGDQGMGTSTDVVDSHGIVVDDSTYDSLLKW